MGDDDLAKALNKIGNILAEDASYPLEGTFLYAEVAETGGMVSTSIFKDMGDHVVFRWSTDELMWIILDLWEMAPENQRWVAMRYQIEHGKFDASFIYSEEIDPAETIDDRRERIVQRRYGNKRIIYPPLS